MANDFRSPFQQSFSEKRETNLVLQPKALNYFHKDIAPRSNSAFDNII